jgi:hypothetical protein
MNLSDLDAHAITKLAPDQFRALLAQLVDVQSRDKMENQLLYYQPNSEGQRAVHLSRARVLGVSGGNRSGKTESCLADLAILATGVFPIGADPELLASWRERFRGPINIRVVVESLTTTLDPIIKPKLQFWRWSGVDRPGGEKGHWGWIPKLCLKNASWDSAWTEKTRTLVTICRDPDNFDRVLGESHWQFMSFDQDPSDFASGSFHHVLHDEPPPHAIWRENKPRVWDVGGRLMVAMTWPDDPSIPVDWIYDELYERGIPGPNKDPETEWLELSTLDNKFLNQEQVAADAAKQDERTRQVRTFGKPIRFSNRIHPLFTDHDSWWSFPAGREVYPTVEDGKYRCPETGSDDIAPFNHVREAHLEPTWPAVFVIDPHPRKPHMWLWVVVDPNDDIWVAGEGELEGDCVEVRQAVEKMEVELGLRTVMRLIDPNMGRSPASTKREVTWQDEFSEAGLSCDLADDSGVGRQRLNQYLKPDPRTRRPRFHVHPRCQKTIWQTKRYVWDDYRKNTERDLKQIPRDKNDDYPTMIKYLMNLEPTFQFLRDGGPVIRRTGTRRGAY